MENFEIVVTPKVGEIEFNLDALKDELKDEVAIYENLVVTEENLKESKKDLATLRKVRTELDERKKSVKKAFMEPYTKFENEVKEAFAILDKPILHIDSAVKGFEEERKARRMEEIKKIYQENIEDLADFIPLEKIFLDKWLNATSDDRDVIGVIATEKIRVRNDLNAIKALGSEIEDEVINAYKTSGTLSAAIQRNSDYLRDKAKVVSDVTAPNIEYTFEDRKPIVGMVTFRVKEADASRVEEMLSFAEIEYERG